MCGLVPALPLRGWVGLQATAAGGHGDKKRLRMSVLSYKEGILEKLNAIRLQKEGELRRRTGRGAAVRVCLCPAAA